MEENQQNEEPVVPNTNEEHAVDSTESTPSDEVPAESVESSIPPFTEPPLNDVAVVNHAIRRELGKVIIGQGELMDLMTIALLIKGHILIEGVPGIAKTLTAKLFAKTIDAGFSRIQFTPDLMPSDVLGTNVFNSKTQEFDFKAGPIFSDIIVVDEINRAPAKTQAAMFEVMQEFQVSIDGVTRPMGEAFMVLATQNPVDHEGTYTLPEAQLDRFLFKINLIYPTADEELQIFERFQNDFDIRQAQHIEKVVDLKEIKRLRKLIEEVAISPDLIKYIGAIIQETRNTGDLYLGASTRAGIWLTKAAKASAALAGRRFVTPDDVRKVTVPTLNHRIILSPQREMEGVKSNDILNEIIQKVEVPR